MASTGDYDWLDDVLADAACVTVVTGSTVAQVLAAFRADPAVDVPIEDAYGDGDAGFVAVYESAGAVVAVEPNGFWASLPEHLAPLSAGGTAASMFWNVNDDNAFTCARDGVLVATVDMYDAEDADEVDLPDDLRPLFVQAAEGDHHAVGMAMVEAFTGVRVVRADVEAIAVAHPYEA
jgi:hypothetical protein